MLSQFSTRHYAALSILLPLTAVMVWSSYFWIHIVFILWTAALSAYWIYSERKQYGERQKRIIQTLQLSAVRTLNHHRHDWMNDLQVLYGYARLQKQDRWMEYMEKVKDKMTAESDIAKLGNTALISYIQSFRTLTNQLTLDVEIEGRIVLDEIVLDSEKIAQSLIDTLNAYRMQAIAGSLQTASLKLRLFTDQANLYAQFVYEGEMADERRWKQRIDEQLKDTPVKPADSKLDYTSLLLKAELHV